MGTGRLNPLSVKPLRQPTEARALAWHRLNHCVKSGTTKGLRALSCANAEKMITENQYDGSGTPESMKPGTAVSL
jgi:hypothetical protein